MFKKAEIEIYELDIVDVVTASPDINEGIWGPEGQDD